MALMAKARQQLLTFNPTGLHRYDKHRASTAVKLIPARRKHKPGDLVGPDIHKKGLEHHGMEKMVIRGKASNMPFHAHLQEHHEQHSIHYEDHEEKPPAVFNLSFAGQKSKGKTRVGHFGTKELDPRTKKFPTTSHR